MLNYHGKFTMQDVLDMTHKDRQWHINRLIEQANAEAKAIKTK